jgi:Uma2 family endonuclease
MDSTAFLAWAEGREGRYELAHGRVVMMTGGSLGHALVVRSLSNALDRRLAATRWITLTSDLAVRIGARTVRYPDIVVDVVGGNPRDLAARTPVLIAEVLSPSSVATDLGDKAAEYLRLDSVLAYLVLSQDEPKAWVWVKDELAFVGPKVAAGEEAVIQVAPLSIELPLAEIYRDFPKADSEA